MKRRSSRRTGESGAYLAFATGIVFTLLAIVSLAVDAANLYRSKMRIQRAIDAGTLAGVAYLANFGSSQIGHYDAWQIEVARFIVCGVVNANLTESNIKHVIPPADVAVSPEGEISVNGSNIQIPLFLLRFVPGFSQSSFLSANARAVVGSQTEDSPHRVLSIVIDTAASMNSPADWRCTWANPPASADCSTTILDRVKQSIIPVINGLNANDQVSLVTFGEESIQQKAMSYATTTTKSALIAIINGLSAAGRANLNAGVVLGGMALADAYTAPTTRPTLMLITHEAPSVDFAGGGYLEDTACGIGPDGANSCRLMLRATIGNIACSQIDLSGAVCQKTGVRRCYLRTLESGDALRATNPNMDFAVVGIGASALESTDAYQNPAQANSLKSYFLRRLSNDKEALLRASDRNPDNNDPAFDCIQDYDAYNRRNSNTPSPARGRYYPVASAADLEDAFATVMNETRPRLIE